MNHPKTRIPLSIGDPTVYGNLRCPEALLASAVSAVSSCEHNGYLNALGSSSARTAIAKFYSTTSALLVEVSLSLSFSLFILLNSLSSLPLFLPSFLPSRMTLSLPQAALTLSSSH
jgi:hypothetical protein